MMIVLILICPFGTVLSTLLDAGVMKHGKKYRKLSELLVDNTGEIEYRSLIICIGIHFRFARHMRTL